MPYFIYPLQFCEDIQFSILVKVLVRKGLPVFFLNWRSKMPKRCFTALMYSLEPEAQPPGPLRDHIGKAELFRKSSGTAAEKLK
jgi:hypothetical protein